MDGLAVLETLRARLGRRASRDRAHGACTGQARDATAGGLAEAVVFEGRRLGGSAARGNPALRQPREGHVVSAGALLDPAALPSIEIALSA